MTVECGFGGQKFQEHVLDKVRHGGGCPLILLEHALPFANGGRGATCGVYFY